MKAPSKEQQTMKRQRIIELYLKDETLTKAIIAERLNCHPNLVRTTINEYKKGL